MGKVIRAFCWHQKFVPKELYALAPGLYTGIKSLKMCIKSDFEEIILKLATYGQREKAFLLSSKFCPQYVVCPCPGLYTCGKTEKTCIKSDFKEIVLKLAWMGKVIRAFCWHQHFSPRGCLTLPWGYIHVQKHYNICMYQDQVSGERLQNHWSSGIKWESNLIMISITVFSERFCFTFCTPAAFQRS